MAAPLAAAAPDQSFILCKPSTAASKWLEVPAVNGPAIALQLMSHPTLCAVATPGSLGLGSCIGAPEFKLAPSKRYPARGYNLVVYNRTSGNANGMCVDAKGLSQAQLYKCVDSANQGWDVDSTTGAIRETFDHRGSILGLSSDPACEPVDPKPPSPSPSPPARGYFCPRYHPIGGNELNDPSGPMLDNSGLWHLYEDEGGWSKFTSRDLVHWNGSLHSSTHFNGLTGSVSSTPSGIYAFWPGRNKLGVSAIESAVCEDCTSGGAWSNWSHRGFAPGLVVPQREAAGSFRDPARAFLFEGDWYIGVGCGQSVHDPENGGGAVCLFKAKDDTLAEFTDMGPLFRTNHSYGSFGKQTVAYNRSQNVSFNMIECPDIFQLGGATDKWVVLASIAHSGGPNQWWTGTMSGHPPRFKPNQVGLLDYGQGYAAKSGSIQVQSGSSRRVVFGFTGWSEPTGPQQVAGAVGGEQPGCGRYLVLPRELSVPSGGGGLYVDPVPELAALRVHGSRVTGLIGGGNATSVIQLVAGAQVEIDIVCNRTSGSWPSKGKVALRTLAGADGSHFTEVGWDFAHHIDGTAFYVDHTRCCRNHSTIVQRAVVGSQQSPAAQLHMRTFVDSGMFECFSSGVVITALVNPDSSPGGGGLPAARLSSVTNTAAGISCSVTSYKLSL